MSVLSALTKCSVPSAEGIRLRKQRRMGLLAGLGVFVILRSGGQVLRLNAKITVGPGTRLIRNIGIV
jgi:hypothetical protein